MNLLRYILPSFLAVTATQANLIQNGSFESAEPGGTPPVSGYQSLGPGATAIDHWSVSNGRIDWAGVPYNPKDGSMSVQLVGDGSAIAQTVGTATGQPYHLSFSLQPSFDTTAAVTIQVSFGSSTFDAILPAGSSGFVWKDFSATLVADSTSVALEIRSIDGGHVGPFLDAVRLEPASAVPDHGSSLSLAAVGFGTCLLLRVARGKQA